MQVRFLAIFVCLFLVSHSYGQTENTNLKIWITGGFLGHLGAFCENPAKFSSKAPVPVTNGQRCPTGFAAFGGLKAAIREMAGREGYKLISGGNMPKNLTANQSANTHQEEFFSALLKLQADVIALGQDDLLRAMLPAFGDTKSSDIFGNVLDFLSKQQQDYRFLASNAFIRKTKPGLNVVEANGYELHGVNAEESVPWATKEFSVQVPLNVKPKAAYTARVCDTPAKPPKPQVSNGIVKIAFDALISEECTVELMPDSNPSRVITFRVHRDEPLTQFANPSGPDGVKQAPVAFLSRPDQKSLLVISLIDPAVLTLLESARWVRDCGDGSKQKLVLLPPDQIAQEFLSRTEKLDAIPVLMSDLSDTLTLKVLRLSNRWRVVTLNPDTALLGCVSGSKGCGKGRDGDYKFGSTSVIDADGDQARVLVRPEWLGETIVEVSAATLPGDRWTHVKPIPDPVASGFGPDRVQDPGTTPPVWWSDKGNAVESILIPLMEAMRRATSSEIAIGDKSMVDQDAANEIAAEYAEKLIWRVGNQQMMELFWRHDAYVRLKIVGSDLPGMLVKISQLPVEDDEGYCVLGLRTSDADMLCDISSKFDLNLLRVNGRFVDPTNVYTVAIPQSMAQRLGLGDIKTARTDVLKTFSNFLNRNFIDPPAGDASEHTYARNVQSQREKRWLGMIYMPPASIEVGGQDYSVPSQGDGKPDLSAFKAIPNINETATHAFKFNLIGELHLVPVDLPWFTLDMMSKANLNRLDTYPTTAFGVKQIAYTPDLWTNGAVLRSRAITDAFNASIERIRWHEMRLEPFVGYFDDTSIFHVDTYYQTSAINPITKTPLYTLHEQDRKPTYLYLTAGLALGDLKLNNHFTLKKTSYQHDTGVNYTAPTGVVVGASRYDMNQVRRCGIQNIIDGKGCPAAVLNASSDIRYIYAEQRQGRQQLFTTLEFAWGEGQLKKTLSVGFKGNRWGEKRGGYTPLDPLWSTEVIVQSAFPIWNGISIGPYLRYLDVKAYGSPGTFISDRYGFTLQLPFVGKVGDSNFLY